MIYLSITLDLLRNELLLAVQTEGSNKVENLRLQAQIKDAKEQTDVFEKEKKQLLRELEEEKTGRLLSDEARKRYDTTFAFNSVNRFWETSKTNHKLYILCFKSSFF